jgi:lysozyme
MSQVALDVATALCKTFEGYSSVPYLCPAGYWTLGYGTVYKPGGGKITKDHPPCTEKQAERWLRASLEATMIDVLRVSPNLINHPEALGAIMDFVYNLGIGRYRASTLKTRINAENWGEASIELAKWRKAGGRILEGLVRRRTAESLHLPN